MTRDKNRKATDNQDFYNYLFIYFLELGAALRGSSKIASVFPNKTDIGFCREQIYADFLKNHLPTSCEVKFGGYLFGICGKMSNQIDIIINSDISPQYNHFKHKGLNCVDGTIAVASIKSNLNKKELVDALKNIASIPNKLPLSNSNKDNHHNWLLERSPPDKYDQWPYKIIFASSGLKDGSKIKKYLDNFYEDKNNSSISWCNRPDIIHVCGQYYFRKERVSRNPDLYEFRGYAVDKSPDPFAFQIIVQQIQDIYAASRFVKYNYKSIYDKLVTKFVER